MTDPLARGWAMAEATLARAESAARLVTHWFLTGEDDDVHADDHFGSNERTLRFIGVALPTLIAQLGARAAIVVLPWDLETSAPTLTVLAVEPGAETLVQSRSLTRLVTAASGPPFWSLGTETVPTPSPLAAVAGALVL